jgi:hypothetical protein
MNWFWMNVPAMVVFFAAITGIPLWLSFRHCDTGPVTAAASSLADELAIIVALESEPEPDLLDAR